jgi:hypothetical protein
MELCNEMMFEEGHLHKCEACNVYYRHDDYKCNGFGSGFGFNEIMIGLQIKML